MPGLDRVGTWRPTAAATWTASAPAASTQVRGRSTSPAASTRTPSSSRLDPGPAGDEFRTPASSSSARQAASTSGGSTCPSLGAKQAAATGPTRASGSSRASSAGSTQADRVAAAAGVGHPPGQQLPLLGVAGEADLAGPAQPDLAADAAGEPRPARHARAGQLEPGRRVLAEGRDRRERTGRGALPGPLAGRSGPAAPPGRPDGPRSSTRGSRPRPPPPRHHRCHPHPAPLPTPRPTTGVRPPRPESGHGPQSAHGATGPARGRPFGPTGDPAPGRPWR